MVLGATKTVAKAGGNQAAATTTAAGKKPAAVAGKDGKFKNTFAFFENN